MNQRRARTAKLRALSEDRRQTHHVNNIGTIRTVIPETYSMETGTWSGYTENYVKVAYEAPELIIAGPHQVELTHVVGDSVHAIPVIKSEQSLNALQKV